MSHSDPITPPPAPRPVVKTAATMEFVQKVHKVERQHTKILAPQLLLDSEAPPNCMRMNVLIATVNMGNAMPTQDDIGELVPEDGDDKYDVLVVGMQEATFGEEEALPEPPSPADGTGGSAKKRGSKPSIMTKAVKAVKKVEETFRGVISSQDTSDNKFTTTDMPTTADSTALHAMLERHLPSYSGVVRYQRGEMRLHIYVRSSLVPALTDVEVAAENTGIGHLLANKGGIAARLTFTDTSLSFVTCHIQAHEGKEHFQRRCADISEILGGTKLGNPKRYDVSLISHHTFVFGDLNFRTDFGKGKKENKELCYQALGKGDYEEIYRHDELQRAICNGECLTNFQEGDCSKFPPTFKVKRHVKGSLEDGHSVEDVYNPQRTPSYCDRILFTSLPGLEKKLKQVKLEAIPKYSASDHNPVRSTFTIDVPAIEDIEWHFPSALMSRRPKDANLKVYTSTPVKADSDRIIRDYTPDNFDLDHPDSTPEKREEENIFKDNTNLDRVCKVTFLDMRCRNLTEMDPSLVGGGSDPYIQFVPLSDHLLKRQHIKKKRNTLGNGAFSHYKKTKTKRHNVNPVFDDVIELEIDLSQEKDLLNGKFLALTIIDHDDLSEDDLIGTVVLNLASLVGGEGGNGVRPKSIKGGTSSIEISKPVMKNSMVQGHFEGTVEMCWVDGKIG
eukprot:CAMPEP_0118639124 /NCGR_PEP_ID=MMETSP0785-20121206/4058_1 /TAXON_ID=91992 /ORGANISM="Bolidomonas pacifica, Strain CCMP 1866" /LENGTH=672 /DNA_ID=CAMNT_0006530435 /DNA_START=122 /DNA_END=2137 /DNA_ORIENTATION=-